MMYEIDPPKTESELQERAQKLAGMSIESLANLHKVSLPKNLIKAKGWLGQLIEKHLGASAGSKADPDFIHLGIELKTIPINQAGKPKESTYVCTAPMMNHQGLHWHNSVVYKKLRKVLWVPVEGGSQIPLGRRLVGTPIFWELTSEQEKILKKDWDEHIELLSTGQVKKISAKFGVYLQLRPKAANATSLCDGIGETGDIIQTLPLGFYLRTKFTEQILRSCYVRT